MNDAVEIVIFIMTILIVLSAFTDKIKLPYPILLVVVGLIIGFVPFLPNLALNPDVVFLIFLPPLIFEAAFKTSWLDFKREIKPISTLAISLVFLTTLTVAAAAHYFIAGFNWPLAFLLGAIVSPPDAVAASGIIKGLGLEKKVMTVIEGESLINDASALVAYRYALTAVLTGGFVLWKAGLQFLLVVGGGVAAGFIVSYAIMMVLKKMKGKPVIEVSLSLVTPYLAYGLAEKFHTSGILAVVTAGLYISWHSRAAVTFQTRLHAGFVWDTLIFLLNGIVFIMIGLQLPLIISHLSAATIYKLIGDGVLISIVTIIIRMLWVFAEARKELFVKRKSIDALQKLAGRKNAIIVAWTGTRGVVSLATALALPFTLNDGTAFPKRDDILLVSFSVIMITLVFQGLTLPYLVKLLKIKPLTNEQREDDNLQLMLLKSSIEFIKDNLPDSIDTSAAKRIKKIYEFNYRSLLKSNSNPLQKTQIESEFDVVNGFLAAQFEVINFQRLLIIQFQNDGSFGEEALVKAERKLDIEELWLNSLIRKTEVSEEIANNDILNSNL